MTYNPNPAITLADSAARDSFGRLRTSLPIAEFDAQFTYDLQPLMYEQITNGTGASIAYDSTNRNALMTFSSTATGGRAYMQSYQHVRYRPGRSQLATVTFNFIEAKTNVIKFAGLSDGTNGLEFQNNGTSNSFVIYSGTGLGNQTITQANWNVDKFDGTGPSGITLDITKAQILFIDFQALYTGRVRFGFDVDGQKYVAHQVLIANNQTHPYIQSANLPVRCGMTCSGTVSTTMKFQCSAVASEGSEPLVEGFMNNASSSVTAGNSTFVHALSIRPKTTFNSITNRTKNEFLELDIVVTGNNAVTWQLVLGQAITGTTTFSDVNTTYSSMEYNTAGTISGSPTIVVDQGFCSSKANYTNELTIRHPITLDAAGLQRSLGTLSVIVRGEGATSACIVSLRWLEVR